MQDQYKRNSGNKVRENKESSDLGKLPPQALDLEQAVLGAILIERDSLLTVTGILKPEDFYKESHQNIYNAILELYGSSNPVDILTVTQTLRKNGLLEQSGGAYYVTELTERVNSAAHIETHARIISEYSIKRNLISICNDTIKKAFDDQEDAFAIKEMLDANLSKLSAGIDANKIKNIREIAGSVLKQVASSMRIPDGITGVPSGFPSIDKITGGWQPSDLIIIAARPSLGKTAFVICCAANAAIRYNLPGVIFSLEMSAEQLVMRMITSELDYLNLSTDQLRRGKITDDEYNKIHKGINGLVGSQLFIDDTAGLSLSKFKAKCSSLKRKHNIQWIVVDYLQLMTVDGMKGANREQEISTISRGMKMLAKELNVPVIALSQLSRAVETRGGDKRPQLSDLRESGAIEQDADVIAFLYRAEYYGITEDEMGNSLKGIGEILIKKHRNGALDDVILNFVSRKTKFYDPLNGEVTSVQEINSFPDDASTF